MGRAVLRKGDKALASGTRVRWLGPCVVATLLVGCTPDASSDGPAVPRSKDLVPPGAVSEVPAPVPAAHCDVMVDGAGVLDLETEYLPNVVRCENGGANLEALKAQAIAARSVAYYAIATDGSICDSQGCQVYSCGGTAGALHIQAVEETSGMYLKHGDILTYGFYVAGDPNVSSPSCVGAPGGAATEQWVTYNDGLSGTDVEQTELGFVHATTDSGYGQNRGCMSQWSARCLENDNGFDAFDILRFFYGDDIEIIQAQGECVLELDPMGESGTSDDGPSPGSGTDTSGGGEAGEADV
ncbi:MAG: SpoIID/LytB domain-containing protein, partial [Nannocystaceae bacterium]|nr:SpoIID/LytB domain-containing protein [Nannocystaceae bacterium]